MILDNLQHEAFAQAYVRKGDTFNSAYRSYAVAFDFDIPLKEDGTIDYKSSEYNVCQVSGSRLINRPDIRMRIKEILLEKFDDATFVDARLQEIIEGGKDTDTIQAIKVYNDLKGRITKKVDVTTNGRPLIGLSDEELAKLAEE